MSKLKTKERLRQRELKANPIDVKRDRLPQQDGYVVAKSTRIKKHTKIVYFKPDPNKPDDKPKRVKVIGSRIKVKIKDLNKVHTFKDNDQNLGYIKPKRYGRFTTNPKTPGRGIVGINLPPHQEYNYEMPKESTTKQIDVPYIEVEYTKE
jgi:hypothetical protein